VDGSGAQGPLERSGVARVGDRIVAVNGVDCAGKDRAAVVDMLTARPATIAFGDDAAGGGGGFDATAALGCDVLELSVVESSLYRWFGLSRYIARAQKLAVPDSRHDSFSAVFGALSEEFVEALGIDNRRGAYVALVDGEGRVRWRASGAPTAKEVKTLAKGLLKLGQGDAECASCVGEWHMLRCGCHPPHAPSGDFRETSLIYVYSQHGAWDKQLTCVLGVAWRRL